MVVDFERGFVFVHIPKTGGTSVQAALRPGALPRFRKLRRRLGLPLPAALRAVAPRGKHESYSDWLAAFAGRTGRPVADALALRPICFCRNPYARFASLHRYLLGAKRRKFPDVPEDLDAFVRAVEDGQAPWLAGLRSLRSQSSFIEGAADPLIGRFETLEEDFRRIAAGFGITSGLRHRNRSGPSDTPLSPRSRAWLAERYREDFDRFGYDPTAPG